MIRQPRTPLMLAIVVAAAGTSAVDAPRAGASAAADRLEQQLAGERVEVKTTDLLVHKEPARLFIGTLFKGQTFKVRKLSASGKYAYGFAYGKANKVGWGLTASLDTNGSGGGLRLSGTPSVRYAIERKAGVGRFVSITAVLRTSRALNQNERHAIAAPELGNGERLPDALFGGLTLGTIGDRGHCYVGEVSQVKQRSTLGDRTWRLGLFDSDRVITPTRKVTLKHDDGNAWQQQMARRLGC